MGIRGDAGLMWTTLVMILRHGISWNALLMLLCYAASAQSNDKVNVPDTMQVNALTRTGKSLVYDYPDSALRYFMKAIQLLEADPLSKMSADNKTLAGQAHYMLGEYDEALPLVMEALHSYEQLQDHYGLSSCYNYIGLIYQTQGRNDIAIGYHQKGVREGKTINNKDRQSINNFNIGLAYDAMKRYDSALHYLKRALSQSREVGLHRIIRMSFNRLGMVYYHLEDYEEAETFFRQALHYQEFTSNWEQCLSLVGLAKICDAQGKYDQGIQLGLKSLTLAKKIKAKWDIVHATETLTQLYAHQHSFREAYEMSMMMKAYQDSVFDEEKENKINYIHLKENELAKERLEKENAIQSGKLKQSNLQFALAVVVAISFLVILMVFFSRHQQKVKLNAQLMAINQKVEEQNRDLFELNQTKTKLFSIISHDMRAPFASLHGVLELMSSGDIDEEQRQELFIKLTEAYKNVSGTLDNMLQWAQSQMEGLQVKPQNLVVNDVITRTLSFWKSAIDRKGVEIRYTNRKHTAYADVYQLKIVIRNIIGNAIKFTPASGSIAIGTVQENGKTGIIITDTGVGIPPQIMDSLFKFRNENQRSGTDKEKGTGLGLMICNQLIGKNGGHIEVQSEEHKGSTFTIWVPSGRE